MPKNPAEWQSRIALAARAGIRYTEFDRELRIQNRQLLPPPKLMNRLNLALTVAFLSLVSLAYAEPEPELKAALSPAPTDENKNSTELFNYETVYTGKSDFQHYDGRFGDGDSLYNDFSYAHRFLISGNWYLRLGVEYERFDFGGDNGSNHLSPTGLVLGGNNGLPDHLQTIHALIAYEYIDR